MVLHFLFKNIIKSPHKNYDVKLNYILTEKGIFIAMKYINFRRCCWTIWSKSNQKNLPKIINEKKVDFVILNGENAADE